MMVSEFLSLHSVTVEERVEIAKAVKRKSQKKHSDPVVTEPNTEDCPMEVDQRPSTPAERPRSYSLLSNTSQSFSTPPAISSTCNVDESANTAAMEMEVDMEVEVDSLPPLPPSPGPDPETDEDMMVWF